MAKREIKISDMIEVQKIVLSDNISDDYLINEKILYIVKGKNLLSKSDYDFLLKNELFSSRLKQGIYRSL